MKIQNIIFDMGSVIMDIDIPAAFTIFSSLGSRTFDAEMAHIIGQKLIPGFETGKILEAELRQEISTMMGMSVSDEEFDKAWGVMLKGIPADRMEILKQLKDNYNLYLLSNINPIHWDQIENYVAQTYPDHLLHQVFDELFLSHLVGLRKPDPKIYQHVIDKAQINPQQTVFIDDMGINLKAAKEFGIVTVKATPNGNLRELLEGVGMI